MIFSEVRMRVRTLRRFDEQLNNIPQFVRKKFFKQLKILLENPRHPSLRVKKIQGEENIWEARVDIQYRFTFEYEEEFILLRTVGNHDEVLKNL